MDHSQPYPDSLLRGILERTRTIAVVGASEKPDRPVFQVMRYLAENGYRLLPINPGLAGKELLGFPVHASLADLPERPDMVDIFRNSDAAGPVALEAAALGVPVIWMQLGVRHDEAAAQAEAQGATVIMDRCPKIEHARLSIAAHRPAP